MKAIIHIGTEKTGTSSIQDYLYLNRKKLKNAGYHFIQSAGKTNNRAIPAYCISDERPDDFFMEEGIETLEAKHDFRQKFLRKFESELHSVSPNIHTCIISSEHFHSRIRSAAEMDNVYNFLSSYFDEMKIICYLRDQVSTCISLYSTHIRNNGTQSLEKFLQLCHPGSYYFNYSEMLENWERCFGFEALDVALFSRERFLNADLLDDFTARIDPALVGSLNKLIAVKNESFKPLGQALLRAINITFPISSERTEINDLRLRCVNIIAEKLAGKGQQPDSEARRVIYDSFIESNEKLREKYFPTFEILFAPTVDEILPEDAMSQQDFDVVTEVFNTLSKHGAGVVSPQEYYLINTTIFSCIAETTEVVKPQPELDTKIILNEKDAAFLTVAAKRLEGDNFDAAVRLMSLAGELRPNWSFVKSKLDEYRLRGKKAANPRFLIAYYGGSKPIAADAKEFYGRFDAWLATLSVPYGSRLIGLGGSITVNPDSSVVEDDPARMGGYSIIEAESLDAVLALVRDCPFLETGGLVRISELEFLTGGW